MGVRIVSVASPQLRPDSGDQLPQEKRFDNVVVRAGFRMVDFESFLLQPKYESLCSGPVVFGYQH